MTIRQLPRKSRHSGDTVLELAWFCLEFSLQGTKAKSRTAFVGVPLYCILNRYASCGQEAPGVDKGTT
jgi:hypothetical protein